MVSPQSRSSARVRIVLCIFFAILAVLPEPASAHAHLVGSSPTSGSALPDLPAELVLEFSEPVVPASVNLRLERSDGVQVALGSASTYADDHRVRIPIDQSALQTGTFQLLWSVRSATDGHDSAGIVTFTVGTGRPPVVAGSTGSGRDPAWRIVVRGLWLLAMAGIVALFIAARGLGRRSHFASTLLVGLTGLASSILLAQPWVDGVLDARSTRYLLVAGVASLVAALLLLVPGRISAGIGATCWIAAIVAFAAAGHAAGVDRSTLATAIASTHLALALLWPGALAALVLNVDSARFPRAVTIYSRAALVGAVLLGLAGLATVPFLVTGERAITESTFGRTILVKTALVALLLAIAGTNRLLVRPLLNDRLSPAALRQVRYTMAAELAALAVVVCLAAALSATAPPAQQTLTQVAAPVRNVSDSATTDGLRIDITAAITGTTDDVIRIAVNAERGQSSGEIQRVIVSTSYQDPVTGATTGGERFDATPSTVATNTFEFSALRLTRQAIWTLEVTVRRSGVLDTLASFPIDTISWQAEQPRVSERAWHWPIIPLSSWALLATALVVPAVGISVIRRHRQVAPLSGAILMIALAMIASGFAIQAWQRSAPRTSGHDLAMPADSDLVSARSNYETLCLACHGPTGAGVDTIDPLHQHGSGTNLLDLRSRVLSDGDLFAIISGGAGDSDMPAYDRALNAEQRWDLVAYLRELQSKPADPEIAPSP